jgi:hypothetical protein
MHGNRVDNSNCLAYEIPLDRQLRWDVAGRREPNPEDQGSE